MDAPKLPPGYPANYPTSELLCNRSDPPIEMDLELALRLSALNMRIEGIDVTEVHVEMVREMIKKKQSG